ncbi:hypothetical protein BC829DRAFT_379011 [Chytridium lagenaria]|nr:hypothetical protein BC829DRAFT_379011 [Chytridium lagenaria]
MEGCLLDYDNDIEMEVGEEALDEELSSTSWRKHVNGAIDRHPSSINPSSSSSPSPTTTSPTSHRPLFDLQPPPLLHTSLDLVTSTSTTNSAAKATTAIDMWLRQIPGFHHPTSTSSSSHHVNTTIIRIQVSLLPRSLRLYLYRTRHRRVQPSTHLQQRASEWMASLTIGKVVLREQPSSFTLAPPSTSSSSSSSPSFSPLPSPAYSTLEAWALTSDDDEDSRLTSHSQSPVLSPSLDAILVPPKRTPSVSEADLISIHLRPTVPRSRLSPLPREPGQDLFFIQVAEGNAVTIRNFANAATTSTNAMIDEAPEEKDGLPTKTTLASALSLRPTISSIWTLIFNVWSQMSEDRIAAAVASTFSALDDRVMDDERVNEIDPSLLLFSSLTSTIAEEIAHVIVAVC